MQITRRPYRYRHNGQTVFHVAETGIHIKRDIAVKVARIENKTGETAEHVRFRKESARKWESLWG